MRSKSDLCNRRQSVVSEWTRKITSNDRLLVSVGANSVIDRVSSIRGILVRLPVARRAQPVSQAVLPPSLTALTRSAIIRWPAGLCPTNQQDVLRNPGLDPKLIQFESQLLNQP